MNEWLNGDEGRGGTVGGERRVRQNDAREMGGATGDADTGNLGMWLVIVE